MGHVRLISNGALWLATVLVLSHVTACSSSSNNGNTNCNTVGNACAAGSICLNNACIPLCNADNDCAHNEICSSTTSICEVCPNCRQVPELATINGTGTTDTTPGHAAKHIADSIMLTGTHFSGSEVTIHGGNYDHVALVTRGDVTDTSLEAILPRDLTAGTYTLTIANQAGSDSTQATVLQGEKGDAGIYIAGDGIDVNGDTLSVVFGTEHDQAAHGDHRHADVDASITTITANLATTTSATTTVTSDLSTLANTTLSNITRSCDSPSGGIQSFSSGVWSACALASNTWDCTSQSTHPGCVSSSKYPHCKAIMQDGYTGGTRALFIDPDGATGPTTPFRAYCDVTSQGGGWTLAFNLDTGDGQVQHYNTSFWPTSDSATDVTGNDFSSNTNFVGDIKSMAFNTVPAKELMIVEHNNGTIVARAFYQLLPAYQTRTLRSLFANASHETITEARAAIQGAVGNYAADGVTSRLLNVGDVFIDTALPILINADFHAHPLVNDSNYNASAPAQDVHKARLTVNYGTSSICTAITPCNGHTVGGWGGLHARYINGNWGAIYEGAAICRYCITNGGCAFGTDVGSPSDVSAMFSGVTKSGFSSDVSSGCNANQLTPPPIDLAMFVR